MKVESFYRFNSLASKLRIHSIEMLAWHFSRMVLNKYLPKYYKKQEIVPGESPRRYTETEVILSLTTFPGRMNTIPIVLETLFRQSVKADRIVLWLADNQYSDKESVSLQLKKYVDLGLEIKYCDDLRSHKKYYYSMLENPKSIVVTCDDDILYSEYMLERLLTKHIDNPDLIVCERAHEMKMQKNKVTCYSEWNYRAQGVQGASLLLCPTGCAGCLYPPGSLSPHVFDKEVLKDICFYADDIWLKCMGYMNNTSVVLTRINNPEVIDTIGTNKNGLAMINVGQSLNDKQFEAVTDYYHISWKNEK